MLFAREGAAVACIDIDAGMGEETAAMVRDEGGDAIFIETDLADAAAIDRMAGSCMEWRDSIHVLFNNAAIAERREFEDVPLEEWNRQVAVNLTAPVPVQSETAASTEGHRERCNYSSWFDRWCAR